MSNYHINVINVAWLPDETISKFQSDFGIVARFFANKRKNKNYIPEDKSEFIHIDAILKFLAIMAGDYRYERILKEPNKQEVKNMCVVAERLENMGMQKGVDIFAELLNKLQAEGKTEEISLVISDSVERQKMLKEYGFID